MSDTPSPPASYEDATPVSPMEDAGGVSWELNKAAAEAFATAHLTGTGREEEPPPPEA